MIAGRAALTALTLSVSPAFAQTTLFVPDDFSTIQEAVNASSENGTVFVRPGTYQENVRVINKVVHLRSLFGPAVTTIDGGALGHTIEFQGDVPDGPILQGFTIRNGSWNGIYVRAMSPRVGDCIIRDNWSVGQGGGVYAVHSFMQMTNCLIFDNEAPNGDGGGIYGGTAGNLDIWNCTIVSNYANPDRGYGGGVFLVAAQSSVMNCIVRDNVASIGADVAGFLGFGTFPMMHSNVHDSAGPAHPTNFDADPLFADAPRRDYHLKLGSPCVDQGLDLGLTSDMEGDPRFTGGGVDVGADETYPHLYHVGTAAPGATVEFRIAGGVPGELCTLWISGALADEPESTPFGLFYLGDRRLIHGNAPVSTEGTLSTPFVILPGIAQPSTLYAQALLGPAFSGVEAVLVE